MNKLFYLLIALITVITVIIWHQAQISPTPEQSLDTIIVGTNAEFQPFSFKQDDHIIGFDIDVIREALQRLGKKMVLKDGPFDALIPDIQLGRIHVIAAGITPTPERAQQALFTNPHLTGNPLMIVSLKKNPPITDISDLYGKEVAVNEGYVSDSYMSAQKGPIVIRLSSNSVSDGIMALQSGRAYAFVAALYSLQPYFNTVGTDNFQIIPITGTEESSAFAISKQYPELRDLLQAILNNMEADGTLAALKKKWKLQ